MHPKCALPQQRAQPLGPSQQSCSPQPSKAGQGLAPSLPGHKPPQALCWWHRGPWPCQSCLTGGFQPCEKQGVPAGSSGEATCFKHNRSHSSTAGQSQPALGALQLAQHFRITAADLEKIRVVHPIITSSSFLMLYFYIYLYFCYKMAGRLNKKIRKANEKEMENVQNFYICESLFSFSQFYP